MAWSFLIGILLSVALNKYRCMFTLGSLQVLLIQYFCYGLSVSIFYSKIDFSFYSCHKLIGRLFFRYFVMSCFVCIARPYHGIIRISLLSFELFLPVLLSDLPAVVFLSYLYSVGFLWILSSLVVACCRSFFICPSIFISHPGFVSRYGFLVFLLYKLTRSVLWCPLEFIIIIHLLFLSLPSLFFLFQSWFLSDGNIVFCLHLFVCFSCLFFFFVFFTNSTFFCFFMLRLMLKWGDLWRLWGECPRGVMVKAIDHGIVVSKFVLQSRY